LYALNIKYRNICSKCGINLDKQIETSEKQIENNAKSKYEFEKEIISECGNKHCFCEKCMRLVL
jgi:hypothetical protein